MAILEILKYPDERLTQKSEVIDCITPEVVQLANNMVETMYASRGVGLAAPQVGEFIRLIVLDFSGPEEQSELHIMINPELTLLGEQVVSPMEGCLSVPHDYRADVKRYERVLVKGLDLDGKHFEYEWDGFPAIVVQHEFDHLEGKLFIDHIGRLRRTLFDTKIKKFAKRVAE